MSLFNFAPPRLRTPVVDVPLPTAEKAAGQTDNELWPFTGKSDNERALRGDEAARIDEMARRFRLWANCLREPETENFERWMGVHYHAEKALWPKVTARLNAPRGVPGTRKKK